MKCLCKYVWQTDTYDCLWTAIEWRKKTGGEASLTNNVRRSLLGTDTKIKMSAEGLLGSSLRRFTAREEDGAAGQRERLAQHVSCGWGPGLSSSHVVNSRARLVLQHQPQLKQRSQGFVSLPQPVVGLGRPLGTDVILGEAAPSSWCQRPLMFPTAGLWGPQSWRGNRGRIPLNLLQSN